MNKASKRGKTFEQRFIDELAGQCQGEEKVILNRILRDRLGWQDERFNKVRAGLIKKGVIKAAPGHGGKTKFVEPHGPQSQPKALKIFLSYCHADEALKNELRKHLQPLEKLGIIKVWCDRSIKPGDNLAKSISQELESSDLFIPLVSIDFINSDYCYDIELNRAMELHGSGNFRVVPIILRECLWNHAPFGGLLALPKDAKALTGWSDRDEAFTSIARSIHALATGGS